MREVQLLADVAVGPALWGERGDWYFLRGELMARLGKAMPAPFAGRTQLAPRLLAPRHAAERVESVARGAQRRPGIGDPPLAAQPLAVREQESRALEGPASEVHGERIVEAPLRCGLVGRPERARVAQVQLDPDRRTRTRRGLHLRQ